MEQSELSRVAILGERLWPLLMDWGFAGSGLAGRCLNLAAVHFG